MKWLLVYFVGLFVFAQLLVGCNNPTKALNWITPDRLGIGKATGMNRLQGHGEGGYGGFHEGYGHHNHGTEWGDQWSRWDIESEMNLDMFWFEWDFPQWDEPNDYDKFLRERVRTLQLEKTLLLAERSLQEQDRVIKKKDAAINKTIKNIDNALRREGHGEIWPKKLTEQY